MVRSLFQLNESGPPIFDVATAERFLRIEVPSAFTSEPLTLVQNWWTALAR